jgi:hypothetical protein
VGTQDGHVAWSIDGGVTAGESSAVVARDYVVNNLRGVNFRHREYAGLRPGRGATRLFLLMLQQGLPVTRWASWMANENPHYDITGIALPPAAGRMIAASPRGILVSDAHRGVWTTALGGPRPKGEDIAGFAVAIDPEDPSYVLAGTSAGLWVSHDGGRTFFQHRERKRCSTMACCNRAIAARTSRSRCRCRGFCMPWRSAPTAPTSRRPKACSCPARAARIKSA